MLSYKNNIASVGGQPPADSKNRAQLRTEEMENREEALSHYREMLESIPIVHHDPIVHQMSICSSRQALGRRSGKSAESFR